MGALLPFGKPLHFSTAKSMSQSPKHFAYKARTPHVATGPMRIGTATHRLVLGGRMSPVYEGRRAGKDWEAFAAQHSDRSEILSTSEFEKAKEIADACSKHPVVQAYLDGAWFERPLSWEVNGVACETLGIDILSTACHGDFKTVPSVAEKRLLRHLEDMLYHAQIAWYDIGLDAVGYAPRTLPPFLLCAEKVPPYDVRVVELSPDMLERGKQMCLSWLEQIKACAAIDEWPGYSFAPLLWEPWKPADMFEIDEDEADEDEAEGEATDG